MLSRIEAYYTNWKGGRRSRQIRPIRLWYGSTQWHPEPQDLLRAVDLEDGKTKDFAVSGFDHPDEVIGLVKAGMNEVDVE